MNKFILKTYNSPTFMTWFSFSAKALSLIVVLPLILSKFNESEIALWYLFNTLFGFQLLGDIGFTSTFARIISYAMAGLDKLSNINQGSKITERRNPNWGLIIALKKQMDKTYFVVSLISTSLITGIALIFLRTPIDRLDDPNMGYALLVLILLVLYLKINNNKCVSFLQATNNVALLRRWEGLITYIQILSSISLLLFYPSFVVLVLNNQFWILIGIVRNSWLTKNILKKNKIAISNSRVSTISKDEFKEHVITPAWKSGIGVMSSLGLNQLSSFFVINYLTETELVIYLVSFRFITVISEFSRAPFYSKLPGFAQLYQSNDRTKLIQSVKKSIDTSTLLAAVCCIFLLIFGDIFLTLINSKVKHLDALLWLLLSVNIILERLGAMHYQFHSLSNKIIWHRANLIYGLIFILVALSLIKTNGLYSMPIGMLAGNLFYYTFNGIKSSYSDFKYDFLKFNSNVFIYTAAFVIINVIYIYI